MTEEHRRCRSLAVLSEFSRFEDRKQFILCIALFGLALFVRLLAIHYFSYPPTKDELQYHNLAVNMLSGHGYVINAGEPSSYRSPAYPTFLALIYGIFGNSYLAAYYVQAVLTSMLVFPVFFLARGFTGSENAGFVASLIYSLHTCFLYVPYLFSENLLMILGIGVVICSYLLIKSPDKKIIYAVLCGAFSGMMGLTKPEFSLIGIGFFMFCIMWGKARAYWRHAAVIAVVSLLFVVPWEMRNINLDRSNHGNGSLLLGTIVFANCPALTNTWWWTVSDWNTFQHERRECFSLLGGATSPGADRQLQMQAFDRVKNAIYRHPLGFVELCVNRLVLLWASPPRGADILIKYIGAWAGTFAWIVKIAFALFAFSALFFLVGRRPEAFSFLVLALYASCVYALTHAVNRYGIFFVPEMSVLVACLLCALYGRIRMKRAGGMDAVVG